MNIRAWIFDLGNTLMSIPSEFDEESCLQAILGYGDSEQVRSIIYRLCDLYPGQTIEEFLRRFDIVVNPNGDTNVRPMIISAWNKSIESAQLKNGVWQILDELRAAGMKLGLVSNTPPTSQQILDRLKLRERFDVIVFSCEVGYLKPDPRIFEIALKRLKVDPQNAIVVGDKIRTDILGGAILGMKSVLVEERLRCVIENGQNYVDAIIPNLIDLKNTSLYRNILK